MNKRGIPGVPYLGEETDKKLEKIYRLPLGVKKYFSLYELVQTEKSADTLVIVEQFGKMWCTYLRDIRFDYKHRKVFIPYYTYDVKITDAKYNKKKHIHLMNVNEKVGIRYNYCLKEIDLSKTNEIVLYNFSTNSKYIAQFTHLFGEPTFDMNELYSKYIDYSRNFEDNLIHKHTEGYHIISRDVKGIQNIERNLRIKYALPDYKESSVDLYYRDVRNLSENEFESKIGIDMCEKPYWERRIDFESLLFCAINDNSEPKDDFREEWTKVKNGKSFAKYGDKGLKLIIKSYWFNTNTENKKYSWSRI